MTKPFAKNEEFAFIDREALHARLPISERTLHSWIRQGLIPHIRLPGSRRLLFHWPSVEAALKRHSINA